MNTCKKRSWSAGLASLCLALGQAAAASAASPDDGRNAGTAVVPALPPIQSFAEVVARPVFAPDRRPHEVAPTVAATAGPIQLVGVVVLPGERFAIVKDRGSKKSQRVAEGQRIAAGTVERIMPDRIVMRASDGTAAAIALFDPAALRLPAASPAAASAPTPAAAGAAPPGTAEEVRSTRPGGPAPRSAAGGTMPASGPTAR